jgi:Domain of unknown function (DUF4150)
VSLTINVNGLTLCHRGDGVGVSTATLPDVCKTPPNSIPLPYPNISFATDLAKGTTTVFVSGGNMAANRGSEFAKSVGDEAGAGGGVKSGVNLAKSTWLLYSMDVFLEGQNACRLTDKMLQNEANSADLAGFLTEWIAAAKKGKPDCPELLKKIDEVLNGNKDAGTSAQRGLKERFFDQIHGKNGPGTKEWDGHQTAFLLRQAELAALLIAYATWCGTGPPPPAGAWEWAYRAAPKPAEWVKPVAPMSFWSKLGWGVAAVGLTALTVAAVVSPFDGPAGDVAAGSAAVGAWGRVFAGAAAAGF